VSQRLGPSSRDIVPEASALRSGRVELLVEQTDEAFHMRTMFFQ